MRQAFKSPVFISAAFVITAAFPAFLPGRMRGHAVAVSTQAEDMTSVEPNKTSAGTPQTAMEHEPEEGAAADQAGAAQAGSPEDKWWLFAGADRPLSPLLTGTGPRSLENGRVYEVKGLRFEAGFVPDKKECLLDEPIFVSFWIRNTGNSSFYLRIKGDVRTGRAPPWASLKVFDEEGSRIRERLETTRGIWFRYGQKVEPARERIGGVWWQRIQPCQVFAERLFLPNWAVFAREGVYTITCRRHLVISPPDKVEENRAEASLSFQLSVRRGTHEELGEIIERLGKQVRAGNEAEIIEAALALCAMEDERVVPHLLYVLGEKARSARVRGMAATALRHFPRSRVVTALVAALKDDASYVQHTAAWTLGQLKAAKAVPALIEALEDTSESVRHAAAYALGEIGDRAAVEPLRKLLSDEEVTVRLEAAEALYHLGEPFRAEWVEPFTRSDGHHFQRAAHLLVRLSEDKNEAAAVLARCLEYDKPQVNNYFNYVVVDRISDLLGTRFRYIHDFDRKGTYEEQSKNRKTLEEIRRRFPPGP